MNKHIYFPILAAILLSGCSVKKKLEISAPFTLGETFAQEWLTEEIPTKSGYDVIIAIVSLDEDEAVLHNLYHQGMMTDINIEMREIGMVAVAEFPAKDQVQTTGQLNEEPFPFELRETEAVLSYVRKDKVRYIKINGIRQNPVVTYPTALVKRDN